MSATAIVVYGPYPDDPEEYPYALVLLSREAWESRSEWYASYSSEDYLKIYDELADRFGLDELMENTLSADDEEHYRTVLSAFAEDPRLQWVEDLYAEPGSE